MKALILILASSFLPTPARAAPQQPSAAPRIQCERPRALFLRRFEDASAWLECGGRVLVRVSVPG